MQAPGFLDQDRLAVISGQPEATAIIKHEPEDFLVDEDLGFEPTGAGEHLFLRIRKCNLSTTEVARQLMHTLQLRNVDVGYSGMKDRRAQTTQWFSVVLPEQEEARLNAVSHDQLQIMETARNDRKLKTGSHRANHFRLKLRDFSGDRLAFEGRLDSLQMQGVPNYFGKQRFGRDMANLQQVQELFSQADDAGKKIGRNRRGMLYSAARAYLFNQVLSQRIEQGNWNQYVAGDVLNLDGSQRWFFVDAAGWDSQLQQRMETLDIHPTGPLAGRKNTADRYVTRDAAADIEEAVLVQYPVMSDGLNRHGLQAARRPLRFRLTGLMWNWLDDNGLELSFSLARGAYASSLIREICVEAVPSTPSTSCGGSAFL